MMMKKLPIGIENFEKLRREDFYYVDKTGLIKELLENWGEVNLFTRPRRFGKSLNMNMLQYFFEYGCDGSLFDGLEIAREKTLCEEYMGKFPVVSMTLKDVASNKYVTARGLLCTVIGREAIRFSCLKDSPRLSDTEKEQYAQLVNLDLSGQHGFLMSNEVMEGGLRTLCFLLWKHYGRKVVLLIDEYDVPLDKAQQFGYYDEMVGHLRGLLGQALKSNHCLQFAVLTGCLRVAKESIFTGLNNLCVFSVTNAQFDEHFGFSDNEVKKLLEFYGLEDKYGAVKEWYDGYRFGEADVYCPWDVINYVAYVRANPNAAPKAFWINTSGNDVIRTFLRMAKGGVCREIEDLANGKTVTKEIHEELTYRDLYGSIDNLWSLLFTTGYLTQRGKVEGDEMEGEKGVYDLAIPNREIRVIFIRQIMEWIQEEARKDTPRLDALCDAVVQGDAKAVEEQFHAYLRKTISIRDTGARKPKKENFYHGILLGLLSHREDWYIRSNVEAGDGYSDILIEIEEEEIGIIIEIKYAEGSLEAACDEALAQIKRLNYEARLREDGMGTILQYGIACKKKSCMVQLL